MASTSHKWGASKGGRVGWEVGPGDRVTEGTEGPARLHKGLPLTASTLGQAWAAHQELVTGKRRSVCSEQRQPTPSPALALHLQKLPQVCGCAGEAKRLTPAKRPTDDGHSQTRGAPPPLSSSTSTPDLGLEGTGGRSRPLSLPGAPAGTRPSRGCLQPQPQAG